MSRLATVPLLALLVSALTACADVRVAGPALAAEFIFHVAPYTSAHASTLAETRDGLVAAWFGGAAEGVPDVAIWFSRHVNGAWTTPVEIASGLLPDGRRYACWNPVLFAAADATLMLYYKIGANPREWWGMVRVSRDNGRTWDAPRRLPDGVVGPAKNKLVQLADGTLLAPSSTESPTTPSRWRVHFERSTDAGQTWTSVVPSPPGEGPDIDAIQPSLLVHRDGRLQALGRTRSQRVFETWSSDGGRSWTPLALTALPNPDSSIDAITLQDGRYLLVYNHATTARSPLNIAISTDGKSWAAALVIESGPGEYSYPAVIQTADGRVHVTYSWHRRLIKHVVFEPWRLRPVSMPDGNWPSWIR
jgi:predicted neuraminidase